MVATAMKAATILTLTVALIVAGCSGAGVCTYSLRGGPVQTLATNHLAAFVLVKSWLVALHGEPDPGAACEPVFEQEQLPDGSLHFTGVTSDCQAYDYVIRPDGSGEGVFGVGGDREVQMTWGAPVDTGGVTEQDILKVFWDGMRMDYTWRGYFEASPFVAEYDGTATLPDGRSMQFDITRTQAEDERIDLALADGATCTMQVPLRWTQDDGFASDYVAGLDGQYVSPAGEEVQFDSSGNEARLAEWTSATDGITGEFAVGADYSCVGEVLRDGDLAASLRWSQEDGGALDLLSGDRTEVGPAGAALDFAIDRWIHNAAMLGPTPMY